MQEAEKLAEILFNNKKNGWENITEGAKEEIYKFNDEYIHYLNKCKTEREAASFSKEILDMNGFTDIKDKDKLVPGDKVYYVNRDKAVYIAVIGKKPAEARIKTSRCTYRFS